MDDQPAIVNLLVMIMESVGVEPVRAYDGETALSKYLETDPDIVFTDIYMPNMNGLVLLKKLKSLDRNLPVILFTGYHHYKSMASEGEIQPDYFLVLPWAFFDEFYEREAIWRQKGGKFIVPLPEFKVVP